MTGSNLHPLANPFNTMKYTNFSIAKAEANGYVKISRDPSKLTVPDTTIDFNQIQQMQKQLTVPHKNEVPYGSESMASAGFCRDTSLFKCMDGTVLDVKSGKIVYSPNKSKTFYGNPNQYINQCTTPEWERTPTIDELLAKVDSYAKTQSSSYTLSKEDIQYWKIAEEESKKLEQSMTDEQKQLLKDLADGKIFTPSKLELED